jgi:hypothetical protein
MDERTRRMLKAARTAAEMKYTVGGRIRSVPNRPITLPKMEKTDVRLQFAQREFPPRKDR